MNWWCVAFSVNTEEVWIIDSNPSTTNNHDSIIDRIVLGVDLFFLSWVWNGSAERQRNGQGSLFRWEEQSMVFALRFTCCLLLRVVRLSSSCSILCQETLRRREVGY
ncbi:hypothetical protein BVRB_9g207230 [Beta vulgaris subsp. vulgaris]|nr:hypothetical protein BVRB_9g207230 [Beta vulgaris subsp. vulgaris]